jgi:diguanylate cyclase (GGDEF)-like protein/PAS domain S-box-containing protein
MQDVLFEEKERAEVTLHSIGDAVITTSTDVRVEYLNPVAEQLTGWKTKEAVGQPLENVFTVINEESRIPVTDPVTRCLREGRAIELANHSILIRRDGQEFSIDDSAAPIRNRKGEIIGAVLVFHDITEERRLSRQAAHDAMHDSLTGLVNRREFEKRLARALTSARERKLSHVLCYLDLDQFKIVNDTAGHAAGDELLQQVADLLSGLFRQRDTFARLGGDEFGLLLENCALDQAQAICDKVLAKTRDFSFLWEGKNFQVGVSIGIVPVTDEKETVNQLLSQADVACYSAKDLGRNRYFVYHSEDIETVQRHGEIIQAARMRDAVMNNQFTLYCQSIADLTGAKNDFSRYEVLLRMHDSENKLVLPSAFIPSAERFGLMPAIDRWVIRQTFSALSQTLTQNIHVTINLSGNSLDDESLLEYVLGQLREFSIPASQICFEITETAAIHHIHKARQFTQAFRERGGKIALDDFGSGFSSFRYLKTLPVDFIKIDGDFVREMLANPNDQAMVEAITQVAHTLGIYVIAEHATDLATVNRLRELGVEGAQGFGIGYPIPVEDAWKKK